MTRNLTENREETILVLAPTGRDAELSARLFRQAGHAAQICVDCDELCSRMKKGAGIAFLADESLKTENIQKLIAVLGEQPRWSDIPLLILTSGGAATPVYARELTALMSLANVSLIERPVRVATLLSTVEAALRARRRQYEVRDHLAVEQRAKALSQRATKEAEQASRLKDEFLATVSHELRTPLNAMLGWVTLLRSNKLDQAGRERGLDTIERNVRIQTQLIEDLLDASRIITGKLHLDTRALLPNTFVDAAMEVVRPAVEAKQIELTKFVDPNVGTVYGDPSRLQQVVWNLLSNAVKFTPKGGRVDLDVERVDSHIEIKVSDTGQGIKPEFLPFVFERFRQADMKTTRIHGGLGLGLAIVRQLVELHGGSVAVSSPGEGEGSTFTVQLPLRSVLQPSTECERRTSQSQTPLATAPLSADLSGVKILVVDDEEDSRELLRASLAEYGATVITAGSAREAIVALSRMVPDVLISDIGMPDEDGYELIRKIRKLDQANGGKIPAVALTAYTRAEDRLLALRSGYQMHFPKPIELGDLVSSVANLARDAGMAREAQGVGLEG
jgi:signal transduction histidine kinase/ActR/RegA family two-component response regulator